METEAMEGRLQTEVCNVTVSDQTTWIATLYSGDREIRVARSTSSSELIKPYTGQHLFLDTRGIDENEGDSDTWLRNTALETRSNFAHMCSPYLRVFFRRFARSDSSDSSRNGTNLSGHPRRGCCVEERLLVSTSDYSHNHKGVSFLGR